MLLVSDLVQIARAGHRIKLHVCVFNGNHSLLATERMLDEAPFATEFLLRSGRFGNGLGHNTAIVDVELDEMVLTVPVDAHLVPQIFSDARKLTVQGDTFYRPYIRQQLSDGSLQRGWGRGVYSYFKSDYMHAGGFLPRTPWFGGPVKHKLPEDAAFCNALIRLGLHERATEVPESYLRFHPRDVNNPYYAHLKHADRDKLPQHVVEGLRGAEETNA
jgi:hypothetical protein